MKQEQIADIPIVSNYKYLGIEINYKGTIALHIKNLMSKINYINFKLNYITIKMNFAERLYLYRIYIEPYFIYMAVASSFNNKTLSNNLTRYRKRIFKHLLRLPPNTPDTYLALFLKNYSNTIKSNLIMTL